jgi:hypothetical protein
MQMRFAGTENNDSVFVIYVAEGGGTAFRVGVARDAAGFSCHSAACIYKGSAKDCEHVQFAREYYDNILAPTEQRKNEERIRIAEARLAEARAAVEALEGQIQRENPQILIGGPRRIVVES